MQLNQKQKENLAQFYSNLALIILTAGVVTPILTGIGDLAIFSIKLMASIFLANKLLKFSLDFLQ